MGFQTNFAPGNPTWTNYCIRDLSLFY